MSRLREAHLILTQKSAAAFSCFLHDVAIVGWDDGQQVWIIKNSWSENWGEKGFMRIKYRSNNIGYGAAWVDAAKLGLPLAPARNAAEKAIKQLPESEAVSLCTATSVGDDLKR